MKNRHINRIILALFLIAGIIFSFWTFIKDNTERIVSQNQEYINELTLQRGISIDSLLSENETFILSTANLYGRSLSSPVVDQEILSEYENNSVFDMLRFIDENGDDHTSNGVKANVADRDYFKAGMRGETGITHVVSRVTGEKQIGFYSPVYFDNRIIGIMVGFYGEAYITKMLEYELFGYEGEGWLCNRYGDVLGSTLSDAPENYLSYIQARKKFDVNEMRALSNAFYNHVDSPFVYQENQGTVTGFAVALDEADWMLIRTFPASASALLLKRANREGTVLIVMLLALFFIIAFLLVLDLVLEMRRTREASRNARDVSNGVSVLFKRFFRLDVKEHRYSLIGGTWDNPIPDEGDYQVLCDYMLGRMPEGGGRDEAAKLMQMDHLREALADNERTSFRINAPLDDAEWFTCNFIVLRRKNGEVSSILLVSQDVTALHHREQEEQKRLQQALETAERASRSKTEFLFNMSHDIRTPMNAIMGFTGIAKSHMDDRVRVEDSLNKIESSSKHLLSLINDVLDMSKIESGKLQLHPEDFSITEAVGNLVDMIRSQAAKKNQTLTVENNITHPVIHGDPLRLNQILLNILSNAVKYTPEGGSISFKISETQENERKSLYTFVIKDNGIGMSTEYLPHLFESFTRERVSTVSKIQGTGLGMSISKNLIDLMGGTISVKSELHKGTEFTVCIPAEYIDMQTETVKEDEICIKPECLKGLKLLLAEDNEVNAEIAKLILFEAGFEVDWVENGKIAVERIKQNHDRYNAVLMDVQMPVMNGYEATSAIRALEAENGWTRTPIIAMTANTFEDDKKNAYEAGMDAHIAKPYESENMIRTVAMWATGRGNS